MSAAPSLLSRMKDRYRRDHSHPVNRALHAVGMPAVGLAVGVVWFHWPAALGLFLGGYAVMFAGHFLFEHNLPNVLRNPLYPVIAGIVVTGALWRRLVGRAQRLDGSGRRGARCWGAPSRRPLPRAPDCRSACRLLAWVQACDGNPRLFALPPKPAPSRAQRADLCRALARLRSRQCHGAPSCPAIAICSMRR